MKQYSPNQQNAADSYAELVSFETVYINTHTRPYDRK